ncbi:hypothetical protein LP419_09590 [Massilia sp. H-1]|nr:hypothetical protein LP419_09590 [Massilia sp. H-1]
MLISDASGDRYEIVVDIVANPGEAAPVLRRFYLDLSTPSAPEWIAHAGGAGPLVAGHSSCLGRAAIRPRPRVCTRSAPSRTSAACNTRPCTARAAERMAPACNLRLPGERTADAIAACRNSDNTSHLYVAVAWRPVLLLHGGSQHDGSAVALLHSKLFEGIVALRAVQAAKQGRAVGLECAGRTVPCQLPCKRMPCAWLPGATRCASCRA